MEIDFSNLHHAYLVVGSVLVGEKAFYDLFEREGIKLLGNPDFFIYKEPLFGIDEARALSAAAVRKAFTDKKIFFIAPDRFTLEAQNALLKTFEDPYPNTHFFLFLREAELVIPTLRSRMQIISLEKVASEEAEAEKFLKMAVKDRISFAKKFADAEKSLSAFLDNLLSLLRQDKDAQSLVEKVYQARLFSDDRSASARLILEHLSLVLDNI